MKKENIIDVGSFKAVEFVEVKDDQLNPSISTYRPPGGTENLICVVAVSSVGEIKVVTQINSDKARYCYSDDCEEYVKIDFNESPGIYLVEFWIDGCGPDCTGEYDSWSEFENIIKYKISIKDKRQHEYDKDKFHKDFETKMYSDPGSEYPRCLFIINDSGTGIILDVLNEDKAYKSVIKDIVHMMEGLDTQNSKLRAGGLYEAIFSLVTDDMEYIFDEDPNIDIEVSDIKQIKLIIGDEPLERLSRKEKEKEELEIFCNYIDELRKEEDHIK